MIFSNPPFSKISLKSQFHISKISFGAELDFPSISGRHQRMYKNMVELRCLKTKNQRLPENVQLAIYWRKYWNNPTKRKSISKGFKKNPLHLSDAAVRGFQHIPLAKQHSF